MSQLRPWQSSPAACLGNGSQGGPRHGRVFSARKPRRSHSSAATLCPRHSVRRVPLDRRPCVHAIDVAEFLCASRRLQRDQQVLDQIVRMLEAA